MIISASRRTDIPAFYSSWFFNRLKEGFVYVANPFNAKKITRIDLTPEAVDIFVFWTKDPEPMVRRLEELKHYQYYFQFTLTSYREDIEKGIRAKRDIIGTFKNLADTIGKEKVIWRYDPILINDFYSKEYHYYWFEKFCSELEGYTENSIISFLDMYKKIEGNMKSIKIKSLSKEETMEIAKELVSIASKYHIKIKACCEDMNLTWVGVERASCIDENLICKIIKSPINVKKDSGQRPGCTCVKSIDIGSYNSCSHGCSYCYANFNGTLVRKNILNHDDNSPILIGKIKGDEDIIIKNMERVTISEEQLKFLR